MKSNKNERSSPNFAGLTSPALQAEMKLILAGKWPPLKPLPVFKYCTGAYRAEIYFDRTHGEWICHKTTLASNKVQELRGGLAEMTLALPRGQAEVFTESVTMEQEEQESENEANRRLQAVLEWKKSSESGVLYSQLEGSLSESQQNEINDCIRMSLTAWQLQCNAKNIAFVFDAMRNAGGRLATLIEIAQRNKAAGDADAQAQAEPATLEADSQAIYPTHDRRLQASATPAPVDEIKPIEGPVQIPAFTPADFGVMASGSAAEISVGDVPPENQEVNHTPEPAEDFVPESIETIVPELSEALAPESLENILVAPHDISGASPGSLLTDQEEEVQCHRAVAATPLQARTRKAKSSAGRTLVSPSQLFAPEISGRRIFGLRLGTLVLLAVGFAVGFTVGLNTPAVPPETEESHSEIQSAQSPSAPPGPAVASAKPAGPASRVTSQSDPTSSSATPSTANKPDGGTPSEKKPSESTPESAPLAKAPSTESTSTPTTESRPSARPEVAPEPTQSTALTARNAPPRLRREPAHSLEAVEHSRGAARQHVLHRATLETRRPSPSSAILVAAPAEGSKSLKLTFPEKPIAASSSFAITSKLSVLVPPQPGPAATNKSERLQAGGLVSYVWPRYPKANARRGSSETVKLRATIGRHGEVLDVNRVSGSTSFLPDAMGAIRRWRYKPTLLNNRPVNAQLDITIEFRPPQYYSRLSTPDPSHN